MTCLGTGEGFPPADLQRLSVQGLTAALSQLSGGQGVQEGQEEIRLLREYSDIFEGAKVTEAEKFADGGGNGGFPTWAVRW